MYGVEQQNVRKMYLEGCWLNFGSTFKHAYKSNFENYNVAVEGE